MNNTLSLYLRNCVSNYHLEFVDYNLPTHSILLFSHSDCSGYVYNRVLYWCNDVSLSYEPHTKYKLYILHSDY